MEIVNTDETLVCRGEVGGLSRDTRFLGIVIAFLCFHVLFETLWSLLKCHYNRFASMSKSMQVDLVSRFVSVTHSAIVVPALIGGISSMSWGAHYEPLRDVSFLQCVLCVSIGYFVCDTILLIVYKPPQWLGFAVHHIVASIPYVIYIFIVPCAHGLFILACFLLVEATNIPLHARSTLQENRLGDTKVYVFCLYATYIGWIVFRLANPTFLIVILHKHIISSIPPARLICILPGIICAYTINIFCYAVFVFILSKEILLRWKGVPAPQGIASTDSMQLADLASYGMTDDEQKIPSECPSRLLICETEESLSGCPERNGMIESSRGRFTASHSIIP